MNITSVYLSYTFC